MKKAVLKKAILPLILFTSIQIVNISSIMQSIARHQTWRVVVTSASSVLLVVAMVVLFVKLSRQYRQQGLENNAA